MMRVAILVYDDVDLLDVGGPYEVFLTADRLAVRRGHDQRYEVIIAGATTDPVTAFGGMTITPSVAASAIDHADISVIPGTIPLESVLADASIMTASRHLTEVAGVTASVCTGAFLLGDIGLLAGRPWTTHFEDVDALGARIGSDKGSGWVKWVDAGDVVTSGGLSSGIAMALHLVERTADRELAIATARQIEYDWDPHAGVLAPGLTCGRRGVEHAEAGPASRQLPS